MSRISNLYRLQEIDSQLDNMQTRSNDIKRILENSAELNHRKQALARAQENLDDASRDLRSAENAVEDQKTKIQATDDRLYSGVVTNPKLLQDLQMEEEALRRYLETLEDRMLETMVLHEEKQEAQENAEAAFELLQTELQAYHQELITEQQELELQMQRYQTEREAALSNIESQDLDRYQALRTRLGQIAIAIMTGGNCSVCGVAPAASAQQIVRQGHELVACQQCGRILYAG